MVNGLKGRLTSIWIIKGGRSMVKLQQIELPLKDMEFHTMKLMWYYLLWMPSSHHFSFIKMDISKTPLLWSFMDLVQIWCSKDGYLQKSLSYISCPFSVLDAKGGEKLRIKGNEEDIQ